MEEARALNTFFAQLPTRTILRTSDVRRSRKFATRSQRPSYGKDSYFRGYAGHTRESMLPSLRGQMTLREGDQAQDKGNGGREPILGPLEVSIHPTS